MYVAHRGTRIADVADGTSNTLLFGERYCYDPIYDSVTGDKLQYWGWAFYASNAGDVLSGTNVPMNFMLPQTFITLPTLQQTLLVTQRRSNFGSGHPGGANFALADASVRFIQDTIAPATYAALGTRAGGEVLGDY